MDFIGNEERLRKNKRESSQSMILAIISTACWIYFFSKNKINAVLFYDEFLRSFNIGQISVSCLLIILFLMTRRKFAFYRFYKIISSLLGLLLLVDVIIFIITISTQNNPFSQYYQMSYIILVFMVITIFNCWVVALCEYRIIIILIEHAIQANDLLRNLIEQYAINQNLAQALDEENAQQQQQRVERIQSIDHHQLNLVYGNQCTICDEECSLNEKAVQLKCLHVFHGECIRSWLLQKNFCPNCRDQVY